jgi:cell division protein FtsX
VNLTDSQEIEDFDLGKFIEEEEISAGAVSPRIYWEFIMAALWATVLGTLLLYALCQALHMTADYFLSDMVNYGMQIKVAELSNNTEVKYLIVPEVN